MGFEPLTVGLMIEICFVLFFRNIQCAVSISEHEQLSEPSALDAPQRLGGCSQPGHGGKGRRGAHEWEGDFGQGGGSVEEEAPQTPEKYQPNSPFHLQP